MFTRPLLVSRRDRPERGQRGVVLILAVFAVVLLAVLAVGITTAVRVELLASRAGLNRTQSLFLAEVGLSQARALLLYDDMTIDTLQDPWGPASELALDLPQEFGSGFYRVRVHDACGRIDINEAQHVTLFRLTEDPGAAAAIRDWRDAGSLPGPDGAEQEYYASLPLPYPPRNGPFQTLGELLLVRGVTPPMFFGREGKPGLVDLFTVESISPNTDAKGNQRVGLNEFRNWGEQAFRDSVMSKVGSVITMYDANEIFRGLTELVELGLDGYTSLAQLATAAGLDHGKIAQVIDYLSVDGGSEVRGKVNVNTASPEVLAVLPGGSAELAAAIVARRNSEPFASLGEVSGFLLDQPDGLAVFEQMIDHVTTKSSTFIIESMGWTPSGRGFRALRALVRRLPDTVFVVQQAEEDWPLPPPGSEQPPVVMARR